MAVGWGSPRKKDLPFQTTRADPSTRAQQKGVLSELNSKSLHDTVRILLFVEEQSKQRGGARATAAW